MELKSKIESLLFVSPKPLSVRKLSELLGREKEEIKAAIDQLRRDYQVNKKGIQVMRNGEKIMMVSHPENSKLVADFIKSEQTGELTPAALETLTIIAYRGPITKAELDIIRGVNCALILRNLMIRGLIEAHEDKRSKMMNYQITFDFMRYLGISETKELPDYEKLNSDKNLQQLLGSFEEKPQDSNTKTQENLPPK